MRIPGEEVAVVVVVAAMLLLSATEVLAADEEGAEVASEPLASLYVRQEAALRKLDALIAKVGKVDLLEAKLEELTALVTASTGGKESPPVVEEDGLGVKDALRALESQVGALSEDVRSLNDTVNAVASSELFAVGREEIVASAREALVEEVANATEGLKEELNAQVQDAMENASLSLSSAPAPSANASAGLPGIVESLGRLEELIINATRTTKQTGAAVLNRIRVSNVAMDKRLGAVLHTTSLRQRVLQDTLLAALASGSHEILSGTEQRLEDLWSAISDATKQRDEELSSLIRDTINSTLADVSTTTSDDVQVTKQLLGDIDASLKPLIEFLNVTDTPTPRGNEVNQLCVVPVPEVVQNGTYSVQTHPLSNTEMADMKQDIDNQLQEIRNQLSGLRIYYDTSLHMHTTEVLSEVETTQEQVQESVRHTLQKTTRQLEDLRASSLGFLDAAVTSVSSSAVASAQATANQLTKALKEVEEGLKKKLKKLELAVTSRDTGCPPSYTLVGGTCLLALPKGASTFSESRALCQGKGGDLAVLPSASLLGAVTPLLFPAHAPENASFWVGGSEVDFEEWAWVDGTPVRVEMGILLPSTPEEVRLGGSKDCLAVMRGRTERPDALLVATSCSGSRGALCQRTPAPFAQLHARVHTPAEDVLYDNDFGLVQDEFDMPDVIVHN